VERETMVKVLLGQMSSDISMNSSMVKLHQCLIKFLVSTPKERLQTKASLAI
jgi:hypothetical protein